MNCPFWEATTAPAECRLSNVFRTEDILLSLEDINASLLAPMHRQGRLPLMQSLTLRSRCLEPVWETRTIWHEIHLYL